MVASGERENVLRPFGDCANLTGVDRFDAAVQPDTAEVEALKDAVVSGRVGCDDFGPADIALWSKDEAGQRSLREAMELVATGAAEYLTVRGPAGVPLSKCGVRFDESPDAGVIYQFDTREGLRSLGLGAMLLEAAERRIRDRGLAVAELSVELDNLRARALYERKGYVFTHEKDASWPYTDGDGVRRTYHTRVAVLRKAL